MSSPTLFVDRLGRALQEPRTTPVDAVDPEALARIFAALGLEVRKDKASTSESYVIVDGGQTELSIRRTTSPFRPSEPGVPPLVFHLLVENLEAMTTRAEAAGATVLQPTHMSSWGRRSILSDADGRRIILTGQASTETPPASTHQTVPVTTANSDISESLTIYRNGMISILLGIFVGVLPFTMVAASVERRASDLGPIVLALMSLGFVLRAGGLFYCFRDRGRLVDMKYLIVAAAAFFTSGAFHIAAVLDSGSDAFIHSYIARLCGYVAAFAFTQVLHEVGKAAAIPWLENAARYCSAGWMLAMVLMLATVIFATQARPVDTSLNILRGLLLATSIVGVLTFAMYASILGVAAVRLHRARQALD